jgi:hypothetical protein
MSAAGYSSASGPTGSPVRGVMSPESGSIVVITGAGTGIGRCCAERIASRGYQIVGAGCRP